MFTNTSSNGLRNRATSTKESSILLNIYSIFYLLLDFIVLLVKVTYAILEAIYQTVIPVQEKSVAGEVVLITGTGHGIGKELALQFAALGSILVCWDINEELNNKTVAELQKMGCKALGYKCDVSNREEVLRVAKQVKNDVGNVTVIMNNAGIMPCHPLLKHSPQEIQRIFDINVLAHFWILEAFLPSMIEHNHGHVVGISSIAGSMGTPNLVPYCGAKFAVRGLMEALIEELREDPRKIDVKVTTIYPYIVETGLCKKPRTRFPFLLGYISPQDAAKAIITAMRRNATEASIPSGLVYLTYILRLFPVKGAHYILDFIDSGLDSDL